VVIASSQNNPNLISSRSGGDSGKYKGDIGRSRGDSERDTGKSGIQGDLKVDI
jgi:hypothetical protein